MSNQTDVLEVRNDKSGLYLGWGISSCIIISAVAVILKFELCQKKGVVMHYKKINKQNFEDYKNGKAKQL